MNPNFRRALRLARRIPNAPHPDRAKRVRYWAKSLVRALRGRP